MIDWSNPEERARLAEELGPSEYSAAFERHKADTTIETVAGHDIRPVSTAFGRLFAVGGTGRAFSDRELAVRYATENPA